MADEADWSLSLKRDPANEHDPNAIRLLGSWTSKETRWFRSSLKQHYEHIGFVPAEYAAELSAANVDMPIAAELYEIAVASQPDPADGIGVIIKIILLVPSTLDPVWGHQSKLLGN